MIGSKHFVNLFDASLYVKFVHIWHGDRTLISNAKPHALRILLLFVFHMASQYLDSGMNPFLKGEKDSIKIESKPFNPIQVWELQNMEVLLKKMELL